MSSRAEALDYAALTDRMGYLQLLRIGFVAIVLAWVGLRPDGLGIPFACFLPASIAYLGLSLGAELLRRRSPHLGYGLLTGLLLVDGVVLASAMYVTGGTQSPIRFLIYLHLVAVSLLASYRTGLKIALWHSLLLFVVLYAQAAGMVPPVDVAAGRAIEFDSMPVLNVTSLWLFALATSAFSAMNERELRNRRTDLQTMVDVGAQLDDVHEPRHQAQLVLDGLAGHFGFRRGLLIGTTQGRATVLASLEGRPLGDGPTPPDSVVAKACERREQLLVRRIDASRNPMLARALPGARNLLISPMIADGEPVGVLVLEHGAVRRGRIERRVASIVSQFATIAALNLRNAVLLERVQDLAERDSLTGAANRRTFEQALERALAARPPLRGAARVTSVLFIDLDDFKVVNDSYGHGTGDALLTAAIERIAQQVRGTDLVARLGGDEFAVLTDDDADLSRSQAMAGRLVRELQAPYDLLGQAIVISASIGIASTRDPIDGMSDLVRNADVAMYLAKAEGKARYAVFDPAMHAAIQERHQLSLQLQRATQLRQLRVVYQPIVDLTTGQMAGVEALVRWQHPERGMMLPSQFIEVAEENGTILPIDRWVLHRSCRDVARWRTEFPAARGMFLSVNVSARALQQAGFVAGVRQTLESAGLDASCLVLEITETALLQATQVLVSVLAELRELGVRTVIDDFGTGYCSLSHLRQLPVDGLKIAGEFVGDSEPASRSAAVASAIVALSQSLGIQTVAEGIEDTEQLDRMRALGCPYGQGYLFSKPVPGSRIEEAFRAHTLPATERDERSRPLRALPNLGALPDRAGPSDARARRLASVETASSA